MMTDHPTKVSTAAGTLLVVFMNLRSEDLTETVIFGAIGGISSYLATMLVKWLIKVARRGL